MKKRMLATALTASIAAGALVAPVSTFAATVLPEQSIPKVSSPASQKVGGVEEKSLPSTVIKKAITNAIRYGGPFLGKLVGKVSKPAGEWVTKNSARVADLLDSITNWQENVIAGGLLSIGAPPDVAYELAQWIVILAGF